LPADDAQFTHSVALAHAVCGERQQALDALRRAMALGFSADLVRDEDEFRLLADDPEFQRLTAKQPVKR